MKILVANLGSTSFKYRLFDMADERQLARGGVERIGDPESSCFVEMGDNHHETTLSVPDHAEAVRQCLAQLTDPDTGCLGSANEVAAIGFKAVHGGRARGTQRVDEKVLAAMEEMNPIAPAHNPPYIRAMRLLTEKFPDIPLVAAFETGFHETIPDRLRYYAVPREWAEKYDVRRWGFHGASHRYIGTRISELLERDDLRVISCHLGGSSSVSAIRDGKSAANSFGMSAQSGVPHNNRTGDFDPFALSVLLKKSGKTFEELLDDLANQSGLLGLSGVSGDCRDLENAAAEGNQQAQLALDVFTTAVRHYLGAYLVELGGADVIVFTGGIGENGVQIRDSICSGLAELGILLDPRLNTEARGEMKISSPESRVQIWVVPTNEEIVVARLTQSVLEKS